jgi:hypothetical protein
VKTSILGAGFIISLGIIAACGRPPLESTSQVKFDIDLPKDDIDPVDVQELLLGFGGIVQEGVNRVSLADFAASINVQGSFKGILDEIVQSRDAYADVTCEGRRCQIVTLGKDFSFKLESVSIPVLGIPTVTLGKRVEIFAELSEDLQRFNACRISGLKVKSGFLTPNVDGLLIELGSGSLNTIKIDAGPGGAYPNDACRF